MSSQFGAAQHSDGSGSGDGGTMSAPSVNYAQTSQAQHSQLGGPSTYQFQYRMDSPPSMQQTRPPQPATPQQNVQQSSRYVQMAGSPFVPQPQQPQQQQQQQQHKLPPRTPRPVAIPLQSPTRTPSQQQQQQQQQQRHIEFPVNFQGGHPISASTSQHVLSLQSSAGVHASGGQMQQLRQPAPEHQYSQGSQSAAAPPQSPSVPRSESNAGTTAQHAEADRILHLYMHEYCLKRNYVKSANAIALETGVRTDGGVPLGVESELGLLSQRFRAFWDDYVRSGSHSELQQHARVQAPPQCSPPFSQQHSPFSVAAAGQSARHAASMGADVFGHPYGTVFETPISARSNVMRRIGTEPTVRRVSGVERMASVLGSGSMTPSPFGTGASAAARFWGGGGGEGPADDTTMQHMTPRTLSRETASSMQRLGWEGRPMESLSQEEKTRLGQVVRQAQVAQQAASMQMTQRTQSAGSGSPVSQSTMGGFGLSISSSADSSTGMSAPAEDASLMQNDVVFVGSSNANRKSPNQAGLQRKKRRSSVNMQALSQIQGSLQSEQRSGGMDNVTNLPPAMSPTTAARNFEEQQLLAKQLQSQSQSILRATASGGVAYGTKQQSTTPTSSLAKRRANASAKSQQAQTEAQKQATSQISAQIQQLEQQKQSQQARSKGTSVGEDGQAKGSHISQLRKLQDKASQNARNTNESHEQQQQQQSDSGRPTMHRASSSQGPILTPLIVSSPSAGMAMGPPLSAPATPNSLIQQQQVQQQQQNQHQQQLQQQHAYQPSSSPMMPGLFNGLQNRSAGYEQNASSPFLQPAFAVQERQQAPMASPYAAMHHSLGPPTQSLPRHQQQQLFVAQQQGGPGNNISLCSPAFAFNFQGAEEPGGEYGGGNVSVVDYGQQVNGLGLGLPGGDGGPSHSTQLGSPMVLQDAALSGHAQQQTTHGMPTFNGGGDNAHQQHSMNPPQDAQHPNAFHASPLHPPHAMAGFNGQFLAYAPGPNNGHPESTSNFFASGGGGEDGRTGQNYMPVP